MVIEANSLQAFAIAIARCPACTREVSMPTTLEPTVVVACPHCGQTCTAEDIARTLPPLVQIVAEAPLTEESPEPSTGTRASPIDSTDARPITAIPLPSFEKTTAPRSGRRRHHHHGSRHKKRHPFQKPSTVKEWWRVIFGALVAIPVAQLVLWWVFGKDPLDLAPSISRIAPIVVPSKLRPAVDRPPPIDPKETQRDVDLPRGFEMLDRPKGIPGEPNLNDLNRLNRSFPRTPNPGNQ